VTSLDEFAAAEGAAAGRLKAAGLPYPPPRWSLRDEMVIRRRCAAHYWAAFGEASGLTARIPASEAEMDAIDAADPG
jgi:hypothetical protein